MSSPINRLTVRGSTKMSLHDRFTELRRIAVNPGSSVPAPPSSTKHTKPARPVYEPRRRSTRPSPAVEAALKIKRRSLKQRLGTPVFRGTSRGFYGNRFMGRSRGSVRPKWHPSFLQQPPNRNQFLNYRRGGPSRRRTYFRGGRYRPTMGPPRRPFKRTRGSQRKPPPTREELDAQLDNYMSSTKSILDSCTEESRA